MQNNILNTQKPVLNFRKKCTIYHPFPKQEEEFSKPCRYVSMNDYYALKKAWLGNHGKRLKIEGKRRKRK